MFFNYKFMRWYGYHFSNPVFLTPKNPLITSGPRILKYIGKINSVNDKSTNLLKLSPNPATYFITINLESIGACSNENSNGASPIASIEIYDVMGILVAQTPTSVLNGQTGTSDPLKINVSHLSPGVYFVKVGNRIEKFVKI